MSECCASGSCEVCRRPQGYSPADRERFRRNAEEWEAATRRECVHPLR